MEFFYYLCIEVTQKHEYAEITGYDLDIIITALGILFNEGSEIQDRCFAMFR